MTARLPPEVVAHLESLYVRVDARAAIARDPVQFPRRYTALRDREIAAVFAAGLAYGRVDLFRPVLEQLFARFDRVGGPAAFIDQLDAQSERDSFSPLVYRWNRGLDLLLLCGALRDVYQQHDSLEALVSPIDAEVNIGPGLARLVDALRVGVLRHARLLGAPASNFSDLPRGPRYLLPSPVDGSACKRWNLALRWLVRPATEGVDLGCWSVPTSQLIIPLDTHVLRISRLLGITTRKDGSWRTAVEVTEALRTIDPVDPVRFDFAIAHIGISGGCLGRREATICADCPLERVCQAR